MHFRPMYFVGWLIFDTTSPSFRAARKIYLETYNTREDAKVLAAIYSRIYA